MREDHTSERNGTSLPQVVQGEVQNQETEIEVLQRRCQELTQLQQADLLRTSPGAGNPAADWLPVQSMEAEFALQREQTQQQHEGEVRGLQQSLQNLQDRLQGSVGGSTDEESLDQVKAEIERLLSAKVAFHRENSALRETISELASGNPVSEKGEVQVLRERVVELEASLEQMREEYEHCEDYWQGKLDDERKLYEQEQAATDDRFSELELKIREYEDLLCQEQGGASTTSGRLSPIAESLVLEKQVTDLEDECSALQQQLNSLTTEYEAVQRKLAEMYTPQRLDAAVQTEPRPRSVSLLSGYSLRDKHTQVTPANLEEFDLPRPRLLVNGEVSKHHRPSPPSREQSCRVQLTVMQALSARLQQQEQRARRLEAMLAQHTAYSERLNQQHQADIAAHQSMLRAAQARITQHEQIYEEQAKKLANSDLLVKELYVENSLLLVTVARLESQCTQLAQQAAPGSA